MAFIFIIEQQTNQMKTLKDKTLGQSCQNVYEREIVYGGFI